jgi:hypothetical protein
MGLVGFIFMMNYTPFIISTKVAYGTGSGDISQLPVIDPNTTAGPVIQGAHICPFPSNARLTCTQGGSGNVSSYHQTTHAADVVPFDPSGKQLYDAQALSPVNGKITHVGSNVCADGVYAGLWVDVTGEDQKVYSFLHVIDIQVKENQEVKAGDVLATRYIVTNDVWQQSGHKYTESACWTGFHAHVHVFDLTTKQYVSTAFQFYKNELKCTMSNTCP